MIDIQIYRNAEGAIVKYTVSGHWGEQGSSIVCAGISVLAQSALQGLGRHLSRKYGFSELEGEELIASFEPYIEFSVEPGDLAVYLKSEPDACTDAILETMLIGMYDVLDNDPEGVQISERLI